MPKTEVVTVTADNCEYEITKDALPWFLGISLFYPDAPAALRFGFAEAASLWWLWAEGENESSEVDPHHYEHNDLALWRRRFCEGREDALDILRRIENDPNPGITLDDIAAVVRVNGDRVVVPQDIHSPQTEH